MMPIFSLGARALLTWAVVEPGTGETVVLNYSLQLDGITGSGAPNNPAISVESFSFGASNPTASGSAGPAGAGKVSLSELSLMMSVSAASPGLLLACERGTVINSATLTASSTGNSPSPGSLRLLLNEVKVTSVQLSGASGGDLPQQSISLSYAQIRVEWSSAAGGPATTAGWDLTTNTAI
jgi:type VI secretion system secreted protein Hcp